MIPDHTADGFYASATTAHEGVALRASKPDTHGGKPNSGHPHRQVSNRATPSPAGPNRPHRGVEPGHAGTADEHREHARTATPEAKPQVDAIAPRQEPFVLLNLRKLRASDNTTCSHAPT